MEIRRYRATADFEVSYPHPVTFAPGDRLEVGRTDTTWPGWVWVRTGDGREGWAPESALERQSDGLHGRAKEAYTARELSMKKGDELESQRELNGWLWVRNQRGEEGWVPAFNLKPLS
jgi:SH3-like domain-containing protein